jgi:hypothetical protein
MRKKEDEMVSTTPPSEICTTSEGFEKERIAPSKRKI